jgi:hypothetical protein
MSALLQALAAVSIAMSGVVAVVQAAQPPGKPCTSKDGRELLLRPRDEATKRPDFLAFHRRLQTAVTRRDADAILRVVDPKARVAFDGGAGGVEGFKAHHLNNSEVDFWKEFAQVLALGGTFTAPDTFTAPYTFSEWPESADSFECLAIIGSGVRLRQKPGTTSRILTGLSYTIVQRLDEAADGWQRVRLADGRSGYVASRYLRSPVDYRAAFELKDRQWWLVLYVAGD